MCLILSEIVLNVGLSHQYQEAKPGRRSEERFDYLRGKHLKSSYKSKSHKNASRFLSYKLTSMDSANFRVCSGVISAMTCWASLRSMLRAAFGVVVIVFDPF
tara:strand:- start:2385 stop:2690 length:306 start_codon:yes stop_codon:yes gene_type:complete